MRICFIHICENVKQTHTHHQHTASYHVGTSWDPTDTLDGCLFFTLSLNISESEFLLSGSNMCLIPSGGLDLEGVPCTSRPSNLLWPVGEVLREEPASFWSIPGLVWVLPEECMSMGLLRSAVGEVGVDPAGVVLYSEELLELTLE